MQNASQRIIVFIIILLLLCHASMQTDQWMLREWDDAMMTWHCVILGMQIIIILWVRGVWSESGCEHSIKVREIITSCSSIASSPSPTRSRCACWAAYEPCTGVVIIDIVGGGGYDMSSAWLVVQVSCCWCCWRLSWPLEIARGSSAEGAWGGMAVTAGGGIGIVSCSAGAGGEVSSVSTSDRGERGDGRKGRCEGGGWEEGRWEGPWSGGNCLVPWNWITKEVIHGINLMKWHRSQLLSAWNKWRFFADNLTVQKKKLALRMTRASSQNVGKFYRTVKLSAKNLCLFHKSYEVWLCITHWIVLSTGGREERILDAGCRASVQCPSPCNQQ